jgi:hypothetical protein
MRAESVHVAGFFRLVTLRRSFRAVSAHSARLWVKLEARLLPSAGTVVERFKQIFLEWE